MNRNIVVRQNDLETMVAVLEDDRLSEIYFERNHEHSIVGSVYKGKVNAVLPAMQAAFVDFGEAKNGFLHVRDAVARRVDETGKLPEEEPPINKVLHPGQEVMVQVAKGPTGSKGARLTMNPNLPGRFLVLLPTASCISISRRIEDEQQRQHLIGLVRDMLPAGMGAIVRTAALEATEEELRADVRSLLKLWKWLLGKNVSARAVSLLYQDRGLLERVVRDIFYGDIDHIYVNSSETASVLAGIVAAAAPEYLDRIEQPRGDVMTLFNVTAQLQQALSDRVWLKCGGYLIVQHMEAFTIVDVNTGKYVGSSSQTFNDVILQTNIEAAREVARQLQLRNIGGIVIVDFIDMKDDNEREQVIAALNEELSRHRVKTNVLGFTQLGLLELTRKKNGPALQEIFERPCPFCGGKGSVASPESLFGGVLARMSALAADEAVKAISVEAHPLLSSYIIGPGGETLGMLEKRLGKKLRVVGNAELHMADYSVSAYSGDTDVPSVVPEQVIEGFLCEHHNANKNDAICRINGYVVLVRNAAPYIGSRRSLRITEVQQTFACAELCDTADRQ